ncbi:MAG: hypothetical protein HGB20_05785 [Chlorobiaceae bacterium]|jgi:hypothetical protein|nr:hypothetical protein [Chlorobiaceae bacterium]
MSEEWPTLFKKFYLTGDYKPQIQAEERFVILNEASRNEESTFFSEQQRMDSSLRSE